MDHNLLRWPDLIVIGLNFAAMSAIGVHTARKSKSSDAYFLAGRRMPGWVVGFSLMATIVSSMRRLPLKGRRVTTPKLIFVSLGKRGEW